MEDEYSSVSYIIRHDDEILSHERRTIEHVAIHREACDGKR